MTYGIVQIVERLEAVVLNILPDYEPLIRFKAHEGDAQLGLAMPRVDPDDWTRTFWIGPEGGIEFEGFTGTLSQTDSMIALIVAYVCGGHGGFKRARLLMGADRDRIAHEFTRPTLSGGFDSIGNPTISPRSSDMSQIPGTPQHLLTMMFNVNYPLTANQ